MPESVSITIEDEDIDRLGQALGEAGYEEPREKVIELARLVIKAASREAIAYAAGTVVPATVSDIHAYRVYLLLHAGLDLETAEKVLPALFKVPSASARRFMRNAVARFAINLNETVKQAVKDTLAEPQWDKDLKRWKVTVRSTVVHDWILDQVHLTTLPNPTSARRGAMWLFSTPTLNYLRGLVELGEVHQDGLA